MIYLFFLYIFSHYIIEHDERGEEMLIDVYPYDFFEIKVKPNEPVFFAWTGKKKFYLDIDAENSKGEIDSYGTFEESSNLFGIYFRNKNSSLKFYSINPEMVKLVLVFGVHYYKHPVFDNYINFLLEDYFDFNQSKVESLTDPLIYNNEDENAYYYYVIMIPLLSILYFIFVCCVRCECC